jgi:hypothetical protein
MYIMKQPIEGKLATFDRHIPAIVINGGKAALELIHP